MSAEDDAASVPWVPPSSVDYTVLAVVVGAQAVALGMCVHLWWNRKWPPYITKSVDLVATCAFVGVLWTGALALEAGFFRRTGGSILASCNLEYFMSWSTLCVHVMAFFVRMYRMWRILVKHDDNMWRSENQIILLSSVSLIPVAATWAIPQTGEFDEVANKCATSPVSQFITLGLDAWGFFGIGFLWFVCARQLKFVRRQFNEYESTKRTLLLITLALATYALVVVVLLGNEPVPRRRVAIFYPAFTTHILLWGPICEPFMKKMMGDQMYLMSYTKGFSELPSPAQLKASLAEQLSVDQLRIEFRRYIKTKVAQELVDFYLDSLDREEVAGFFERQAVTMRIVERYIREGAPDQVNISAECRDRVLATDATAFDIFDDTRAEVLAVMETNFQTDFVATEGFRRIADASEQEQRELRLLRAGGMLPGTPPTPLSPGSPGMPLLPRILSVLRNLPSLPLPGRGPVASTVTPRGAGVTPARRSASRGVFSLSGRASGATGGGARGGTDHPGAANPSLVYISPEPSEPGGGSGGSDGRVWHYSGSSSGSEIGGSEAGSGILNAIFRRGVSASRIYRGGGPHQGPQLSDVGRERVEPRGRISLGTVRPDPDEAC